MKILVAAALISCLPSLSFAQQKTTAFAKTEDVVLVSEDALEVLGETPELPGDFADVTQKLDAIILKRTGKRLFEQPVGIEWKPNDVSVSVQNPRTGKRETIKIARHAGCC